ncbi:hypothetical protein JJQ72_04000 [Paenibacillus sp. F411]|uniref:Uncharacterized protein n=1 Tax=Paenibacillus algicola TaxID=2565926 RepID=A0A4P8XJ00_9BACL|nr:MULTISPECIES: hypothetical protein [Paenibacillus]MBO2943145.1 hypothetical protein [Paenibacillus sp. F411]QCT02602.1 hypothetical protein E6C60_1887 [Paenibacillus algicola]
MFQHVFDEMNNMFDEIVKHYPAAQGPQKQALVHNWNLLKQMSDGIIDEWLRFEERMAVFRENTAAPPGFPPTGSPELQLETFIRGQGYYKLLMFEPALSQFTAAAESYPDSPLIRLYLAMSHLHLGETSEAARQLLGMLPGAEDKKLKAIIYNAMGCIQVIQGARDKASEFFTLAIQQDPTLPDPLNNLQVCHQKRGELQYGSPLISLL